MFLLDDILLAPLSGVIWLGERVRSAAERDLFDEAHLTEQLLDVQERDLAGELSRDEVEREEARLLSLLASARQRRNDAAC